jgi:adenylate cyclase
VRGYFELEDLGGFKLKGATLPVQVYGLEGIGKLRTRFEVSRRRGFSKFVGRAAEMARLEAALERAVAAEGRVVGVVGEAGVGKSRLCQEFVELCRARRISVYEAHCPAHGRTVPLLPLLELLRNRFAITDQDRDEEARKKITGTLILLDEAFQEMLPLVFDFLGVADPNRPAPQVDPEARQRQLFGFVRRLVRVQPSREPVVLLVDDLHWIDPGSDAFLAQIVEALSETRTLLLLNFRPEYRADWMGRSSYRELSLEQLGQEAAAELLHHLLGEDPSVAGLHDRIRERAGGNPFFIEEAVQSLVESGSLAGERGCYELKKTIEELEIPATVQSILAARIDRLPEREKHLLQTAAVIGKKFTGSIFERIVELPNAEIPAAISALQRAEFIFEEAIYPEAEYAFKHPLTQEVAYHSQLAERRLHTHAAVAAAIEEMNAGKLDEHAALLAHHWELAGERLRAAHWSQAAARWTGTSDPAAALRHWRKMRELLRSAPETEETLELGFTACLGLLALSWRVGLSEDEARAIFLEGKALGERRGDLQLLALLYAAYGKNCGVAGRLDEYLRQSLAAKGLAERIDEVACRMVLWVALVDSHRWAGRLREALSYAEEALAWSADDLDVGADLLGFSPHILLLRDRGSILVNLGRLREGMADLEKALQLAQQRGELELLVFVHASFPFAAQDTGNAEAALAHGRTAVEIAERVGNPTSLLDGYDSLGLALLLNEDWDEAVAVYEHVLEVLRERRIYLSVKPLFLARLAEAHLGRGDAQAALASIEEAVRVSRQLPRQPLLQLVPLTLARVLLRTEGARGRARIEAALSESLAVVEQTGWLSWKPLVLLEFAELARLVGDPETRARNLREALQASAEIGATQRAERVAAQLDALP